MKSQPESTKKHTFLYCDSEKITIFAAKVR